MVCGSDLPVLGATIFSRIMTYTVFGDGEDHGGRTALVRIDGVVSLQALAHGTDVMALSGRLQSFYARTYLHH